MPESLMPTIIDYAVKIVGVFVLLFLAWTVAGWFKSLVLRSLEKTKLDETLRIFLGNAARYALMVIACVSILGIFGVETTTFAAVLGSIGLAIGLAFQGALSNLAAGLMLLIFRPYKIGDLVNVAGVIGVVKEIELFATVMDTADNRRIIVPNSATFGSTIENINFHDTRRVDVNVGTDYGEPVDKVREVLTAAAASVPGILSGEGKDPAIVLQEMGASSIDWTVRVWTHTADFWPTRQALVRAIKGHLDEAKIGIPFPQMDVHVDQVAAAAAQPGKGDAPAA